AGVIFFLIVYIAVIAPVAVEPPYTGLHQVLFGRGCSNTGITFYKILRAHIPGIFQYGDRFTFFTPLMLEKIGIKVSKIIFHKQGNIFGGRYRKGSVVGAFNPAFLGKSIYNHVL